MRKNLWQRWKRLAHRAAEIQAIVILTALYWIVVAPIGLAVKTGRRSRETSWKTRPLTGPVSMEDARRQS
jgi:hypothetical protein